MGEPRSTPVAARGHGPWGLLRWASLGIAVGVVLATVAAVATAPGAMAELRYLDACGRAAVSLFGSSPSDWVAGGPPPTLADLGRGELPVLVGALVVRVAGPSLGALRAVHVLGAAVVVLAPAAVVTRMVGGRQGAFAVAGALVVPAAVGAAGRLDGAALALAGTVGGSLVPAAWLLGDVRPTRLGVALTGLALAAGGFSSGLLVGVAGPWLAALLVAAAHGRLPRLKAALGAGVVLVAVVVSAEAAWHAAPGDVPRDLAGELVVGPARTFDALLRQAGELAGPLLAVATVGRALRAGRGYPGPLARLADFGLVQGAIAVALARWFATPAPSLALGAAAVLMALPATEVLAALAARRHGAIGQGLGAAVLGVAAVGAGLAAMPSAAVVPDRAIADLRGRSAADVVALGVEPLRVALRTGTRPVAVASPDVVVAHLRRRRLPGEDRPRAIVHRTWWPAIVATDRARGAASGTVGPQPEVPLGVLVAGSDTLVVGETDRGRNASWVRSKAPPAAVLAHERLGDALTVSGWEWVRKDGSPATAPPGRLLVYLAVRKPPPTGSRLSVVVWRGSRKLGAFSDVDRHYPLRYWRRGDHVALEAVAAEPARLEYADRLELVALMPSTPAGEERRRALSLWRR